MSGNRPVGRYAGQTGALLVALTAVLASAAAAQEPPGSSYAGAIGVSGSYGSSEIAIVSGATAGSTSVTVADAKGLAAGQDFHA